MLNSGFTGRSRWLRRTAWLALAACLPTSVAAFAASEIPTRPSAPPLVAPKPPEDAFQCGRYYVHQGKTIRCDSMIRFDGEGLRPIIQDVPEAISELNAYQRNRFKVRNSAYVGTFGIMLAVAGVLLSERFRDANGAPTPTSDSVRTASLIGGLGMTVGGFLYAISSIKTNEAHLGRAVELYNKARPDSPIQLQFSTAIEF